MLRPAGEPTTPTFYLTTRQPLRPAAILLATLIALTIVTSILLALGHTGQILPSSNAGSSNQTANKEHEGDIDDPSQVDTIVLGDPADAPVPARRGDHVSPVHPTILIHLPRSGEQFGLIPATPAGHLLYDWLAAFNHASPTELARALPTRLSGSAVAAQLELRRQTGGFALLSAREVQPGVLVFRLQDQTPSASETLGTLQVLTGSTPPAIATFSLRAVIPPVNAAPRIHESSSPGISTCTKSPTSSPVVCAQSNTD